MATGAVVKRFWQDPYRSELETRVTGVEGAAVTVAESIFYARSGGQESDRGTLAGHPVLQARKLGAQILYTLPADHGLQPGDRVHMRIDWPRRYALMRLHLAAELVLVLICRALASIEKVGAHIAEDKARIDFAWPESLVGALPAVAAQAQALIDEDRAIVSAFSDVATERRYWEIEGFARVPCGGTHLRRTGEIGGLSLRRRNPGSGRERVEIQLREAAT